MRFDLIFLSLAVVGLGASVLGIVYGEVLEESNWVYPFEFFRVLIALLIKGLSYIIMAVAIVYIIGLIFNFF